jgi:hypothetical protein
MTTSTSSKHELDGCGFTETAVEERATTAHDLAFGQRSGLIKTFVLPGQAPKGQFIR